MDCSDDDEPKPSTSKDLSPKSESNEVNVEKELNKALTVEEFLLRSKTYMLDYEKYMFMDTIDADCLVVSAK